MSEKTEETTMLDEKNIALHLEAILFVSNQAITLKDLLQSLNNALSPDITKAQIQKGLEELQEKYVSEEYAFHLVEITKGFQFLSKDLYHRTISSHLNIKAKKRLSKAAMETLAIIAYKQPVTKAAIEEVRGVNSDYGVQKLLEKELIVIIGRSEKVGKPLLYGTSPQFMDHFGLKSIKDLPKLKEVIPQHNQIGDNAMEEQGTLDLKEDGEKAILEDGESPIVENEEAVLEDGESPIVENEEAILEDEIDPVLEEEEEVILEDEIDPVLEEEEAILENEDNITNYEEKTNGETEQEESAKEQNEGEEIEQAFDESTE